jgi:hypothetical protein
MKNNFGNLFKITATLSLFTATMLSAGVTFINPLSISDKSIDNGGALQAIDAYKDGIGAILIDIPGVSTDNTAMNILVFKYGNSAKTNNTTIADQVLNQTNLISPTTNDITLAQSLLHINGSLCDDGNPSTHGETWLNDVCQGGIPNVYVNGTSCDDGDPATTGETWLNDVCQGGSSNVYTNGTTCDDGNALTINDIYTNNVCSGTLVVANNTCAGGYSGDYNLAITCKNGSLLYNMDNFIGLTSAYALYLSNNPTLANINGLSNLTHTGQSLFLESNQALTNVDGLSHLQAIGTGFGGDLNLYNEASLTNVNGLINLTSVNGSISLYNNPLLTDISGLKNITFIGSGSKVFLDNKIYTVKLPMSSYLCQNYSTKLFLYGSSYVNALTLSKVCQ